jgi:hypothetical protein
MIDHTGLSFIDGSRITKARYDLAEHFDRHDTAFTDGPVLQSSRVMGTGKAEGGGWSSSTRSPGTNAMIEPSTRWSTGRRRSPPVPTRPLKKDRFVPIDGARRGVARHLLERAPEYVQANLLVEPPDFRCPVSARVAASPAAARGSSTRSSQISRQ